MFKFSLLRAEHVYGVGPTWSSGIPIDVIAKTEDEAMIKARSISPRSLSLVFKVISISEIIGSFPEGVQNESKC